jgi:23S rRNA (cytidine1920-2'-O)/16S rRNA (cytidine1409-2'-O)-methyltransferase
MEKGIAVSEKQAKALIMQGTVSSGGRPVLKPGESILIEDRIEIKENQRRYASRGGLKLEGIFEDLNLSTSGKTAIDIGSSTGGFTDFLLKNGAQHVTAVDVGSGLLEWDLRNNSKVTVLEKTNVRYLDPALIKYMPELVVVDLSFISISKVFQKIMEISSDEAEILLLVKPQFELERELVKHKGIVKEKIYHIKSLKDISMYLKNFKVSIEGISFSHIKGAAGNIEFWIYLKKERISAKSNINYDKIIGDVVDRAHLFFNKETNI